LFILEKCFDLSQHPGTLQWLNYIFDTY